MYGIYAYIDPQNHPNVGIYMAYMECLGYIYICITIYIYIIQCSDLRQGVRLVPSMCIIAKTTCRFLRD